MTRHDFDEVKPVGEVHFGACSPVTPDGIKIVVEEAYDDATPRRLVMLTMHGAISGFDVVMEPDKAEALASLLKAAANTVRRMAKVCDELTCQQCGTKETAPYDAGDKCICGGTFQ